MAVNVDRRATLAMNSNYPPDHSCLMMFALSVHTQIQRLLVILSRGYRKEDKSTCQLLCGQFFSFMVDSTCS